MLQLHESCSAVRARLAAFGRDQRGVSAVEFAMLVPVLVLLYLGGVEVSQALAVDRKVALTARTVVDLVAQSREAQISSDEIANVMNAARAVMQPYPPGQLKVVVSSVYVNNQKIARIDWSEHLNSEARQKNAVVTLPPKLLVPDTYLIWSEVKYDYTPAIGYAITDTITLNEQLFMHPRHVDRVCVNKCS